MNVQSYKNLESLEKATLCVFRNRISRTKNSSDLSDCFSQVMAGFLNEALEEDIAVSEGDIRFDLEDARHYRLSPRLSDSAVYRETRDHSNLGQFIHDMADRSYHRYVHLRKTAGGFHRDHRQPVKG